MDVTSPRVRASGHQVVTTNVPNTDTRPILGKQSDVGLEADGLI
jgi:hypothetical protein